MSESVCVDTDVYSYTIKHDTRAALYQPYLEGRVICLCFQVVAELFQWAEMRGWGRLRRQQLETAIGKAAILDSDNEMARLWAEITAQRVRDGRPISPQDAWVAACALRYHLPRVTHNARHFESIEGLTLLTAAT